jgi:hypothetical protein
MTDKHLNNDQIAGWISGERDNATEQHLAGCASCRAKVEGFLGKMAAAREITAVRAGRDENYWAAQRMAIADKLADQPTIRWRSLAFATPVLAGLLGIAMLLPSVEHGLKPAPNTNAQLNMPVINDQVSDEELLAQVSDALDRDTPEALQAVDSIHSERIKILNGNTTASTTTSATKRNTP